MQIKIEKRRLKQIIKEETEAFKFINVRESKAQKAMEDAISEELRAVFASALTGDIREDGAIALPTGGTLGTDPAEAIRIAVLPAVERMATGDFSQRGKDDLALQALRAAIDFERAQEENPLLPENVKEYITDEVVKAFGEGYGQQGPFATYEDLPEQKETK